MSDKLVSLSEAVSLINNGDLLGIGGMSLYRRPMVLTREIIRQGIRDLGVLTFIAGLPTDLLIGSHCASQIRSCYVGFEIFGLAPNYRRASENGELEIIEETEVTIVLGLKATLLQVPHLPTRGIRCTDVMKVRKDLKEYTCPLSGEKLVAMPPIKPDVSIIHVSMADRIGNAHIDGAVWLDEDLAKASGKVIISAEKIVETEEIIRAPGRANIPHFMVDAVVRTPFGAHPTSCFPYYTYDANQIRKYLELSKDQKGFSEYLEEYVYQSKTHEEYLDRVGASKLSKILL
ncbi:MAG: CoA transferase subunit A [Candidatus Jordarchaeum sp.]|uniref:CoA transferase subunit A n=1 Tax=Candidatus Jordarchaeum sp. TaxID=2823881 RepID=UPI00404AF65E